MAHTPNRRTRIAREIRHAMHEQGKTPEQLATAAGISPAQIDGTEPLYLEELKAIASFLGYHTSDITRRTDVAA